MQSVFTLIIGGELLSLALVLGAGGLNPFDWERLGAVSFITQWIVLLSAALLCPLRPLLRRRSLVFAGFVSYSLILTVALVVSLAGELMLQGPVQGWRVATNVFLTAIFGGIVLRYFYIQQQLLRREEAEMEARIQALQSRIRPHFLFNCMNSIVSLIGSDPDTAEKVVEDLSDLFRASLAEPGLVPVNHELGLCRRYIDIEKLRLGSRLVMDWQVEELPDSYTIPSLLLQPIIENAIYHGIQPRASGGTVEISVQARDNRLTIIVRNPLPKQQGDRAAKPGNRVALDNIRCRMVAYYGDNWVFNTDVRGENFITEISYPVEKTL